MTIGYAITLALALGLLIAYTVMVKSKEFWLTMLYICVAVVNLGYLLTSLANSVAFAVFANDVAYLGSVFLSMCMLLTIVRLCGFGIKKTHVIICVIAGTLMFAIIATSGLLPLYYKEVWLETTADGAAKLGRTHGVLHPLYLVYLLGYFAAMIVTILRSVRIKKIGKPKFAGFIAGVVCGNIIVWLFEKFVDWEFEFLSVTYIVSELLLLLLYWMMQDYVHVRDIPKLTATEQRQLGMDVAALPIGERVARVVAALPKGEMLAAREREVLELLLENKRRREIADEMHLSENTVKTYTRNLYNKLGVGSREELFKLLLQD